MCRCLVVEVVEGSGAIWRGLSTSESDGERLFLTDIPWRCRCQGVHSRVTVHTLTTDFARYSYLYAVPDIRVSLPADIIVTNLALWLQHLNKLTYILPCNSESGFKTHLCSFLTAAFIPFDIWLSPFFSRVRGALHMVLHKCDYFFIITIMWCNDVSRWWMSPLLYVCVQFWLNHEKRISKQLKGQYERYN